MSLPATENELLATVVETARQFGWLVAHFRPARTAHGWRTPMQGDPGFPDLVLVKPPRLAFVELKAERGKVAPEQTRWLEAIEGCNVVAVVVRPENLHWLLEYLVRP